MPTSAGLTLVPVTAGGPGRGQPLLVLGPSLGTAVEAMWGECADRLDGRFEVVGWELPGHGHGAPAVAPFTLAELADQLVDAVDRAYGSREFAYAGNSIGGAVGLALLLSHGQRVASAVLSCTSARIGSEPMWRERAEIVRAQGTAALIDGSRARWFAPGFVARQPDKAAALTNGLRQVDQESYALACEALACFDVWDQLSQITRPVAVIAGALDMAAPPAEGSRIAAEVAQASLTVLDSVAHFAPVEAPERVAAIVTASTSEFTAP